MAFTDQTTQEYDDFGGSKSIDNGSYEPKRDYQSGTDAQAKAGALAVEQAANAAQGRTFETADKGASLSKDLNQNASNLRINEARQMQSLNSGAGNDKKSEAALDRNARANELSTQISDNMRARASQESIAAGANTTSQENAKTSAKAQVSAALYGRKSGFGGYW